MRFPVKIVLILAVIAAVVAAGYPASEYWKNKRKPRYRDAEVTRGDIQSTVNATGTVQPVQTVAVGSFASGPITELYVDYNMEVKKGQLLARIDPQQPEANLAQNEAILATRRAEVDRAKALYDQATNDAARALALQKENTKFISATELDQFKFNAVALKAQWQVAQKNVEQAEASLENSKTNLGYTRINAPEDGIIINKKVEKGQTVAASFQTPELFTLGIEMREKMDILASVDEADVGAVIEAERRKLPVKFTVDSYPDDLFEGQIVQVRMNATTTQNVVTYPVVVRTGTNPNLKLRPTMTASLSFLVDERKDVLRVPNAALRFYPQPYQVRPEDRKLLEGGQQEATDDNDKAKRTAAEKAEARRARNRRHVWVQDGDFLRAVEVVTGLSDGRYTEVVSGDLAEGQKLVTGLKTGE